jgi:hypothetical protein
MTVVSHSIIRSRRLSVSFAGLLSGLCLAAALWQLGIVSAAPTLRGAKPKRAYKTAPPPKFDQTTLDVFFDDARQEVGPGQPGGAVAAAPVGPAPDSGEPDSGATSGGFAWSKLISAGTLEDEVKSQLSPLTDATKNPSAFATANTAARGHFTELALLFGVIAEYDADVRFKRDAADLKTMFGRAAANSKVSGDNAFKQAQKASQDLADLIAGGKVAAPKADPDATWAQLVNRPPLMARMGKEGFDPRIKAWTSDKGEFTRNRDELLKEAQLVAIIAHVMQDASYEFGDDETYLEYAKGLEQQAAEIAEAVKADSFERAQKAAGQLNKACVTCHEGYRS